MFSTLLFLRTTARMIPGMNRLFYKSKWKQLLFVRLNILQEGFSSLWSVLCCRCVYCRSEATEEGRGTNWAHETMEKKNKAGNPSFWNEDRSLQECLVPSEAWGSGITSQQEQWGESQFIFRWFRVSSNLVRTDWWLKMTSWGGVKLRSESYG